MKKFLIVSAMALISTLVFAIMPFAAEEPVLSSDSKVYINYGKSDDNDGLTADTAKKTFAGSVDLLQGGGTVVATGKLYFGSTYTMPDLGGTLLITSNDGTTDFKNPEPATNPACAMKMYTNVELTLTSDVIIDDIILFQETASGNTIHVTNNSTLVIGENVVSMGSPYSTKPCYMSIEVEAGSTVIAKGGIFQSITGEGTIINTGADVIESEEYILYTAPANALYAIGVIEDYSNLEDSLASADAVQIIKNLTGYESAAFENAAASESEFLAELLCGMGYTDVDAVSFANELGLIDHTTAADTFTRNDAFKICAAALDVKTNSGVTIADKLVSDGTVSERALGFAKRIASGEKITVACVGDSITEGVGSSLASKYSYPAQLQKLLGQGFNVINCGKSGAYVMNLESEYNVKAEDRPDLWYPATTQYQTLMASSPDVVIVMLGTNDARSMTAMPAEDVFVTDYKNLIADIASLESNPEIYLSTMIPAVNADMTHQGTYYTLPLLIRAIAAELELPLVDTSLTLSEYFYAMLPYGDMVHPIDESYPALATNFYNEVFGYSETLPLIEKAEGNVVYLSSNGKYDNGGTSPSDAVDTLGVAVAKLSENGGTVVVCDAVDVSRTHFAKCGGDVVITSVYGGVDYRESGAQLNVKGILTLLSDVTFENVNLNAVYSSQSINCGFNDLTIGEGVECGGDYALIIHAGYRLASGTITPEAVSCHEDCTISIASGTWDYIWGGNQRTNSLNQFGTIDEGAKLSIYISGGEFTHVGTLNINTATGQNSVDGEVYMEISGGKFAGDLSAVCRAGSNDTGTTPAVNGKVTLKVTGGEFGGKVNLYQSEESPVVSGVSELLVARTYTSAVTADGFTTVSILDVLTLLGDANGDGELNLLDALRVLKHLANADVEIFTLNADCNQDGELGLPDVLRMVKLIADK